jgi:hypothetical protein
MDEIGHSYLCLALHLDRHFEGFVDAYFGPPELRAEIETGDPRPLEALAEDAQQLLDAIETSVSDSRRKEFLKKQVQAMAAVIRNLSGDQLGFVQEVELYFDITPVMVDEAHFEAAHAALDELLPGDGSLIERSVAWKERFTLEPDRILPVFDLALRETRRRTRELFDLPPGEDLTLQLVTDQPWGAYNWYLGGFRSRVDLNTDLPVKADWAVPLIAHEAYPGHHTEHAIKEQILYRHQGRAEHAVQLLLAPECVISEGIADNGQKMLFDDAQLGAFLRDQLYPLAGLTELDVNKQLHLAHAREALAGVSGNAALLLHREGWAQEEVQAYLERYSLRTPEEASQTIKFLTNPLFRSYIFNYAIGKALLAPLFEGPDAVANFGRLLSEPFTPSQVRLWLAQRSSEQSAEGA